MAEARDKVFWYYVGCKGFSDCDPVKTAVLGSGPGAPPFGRHIQLVTLLQVEQDTKFPRDIVDATPLDPHNRGKPVSL